MSRILDKERTCLNIRDMCRQKEYNAEKIAVLIDVSEQTVYSWFSGRKMPSLDHLVELADLLEVTIDELIETRLS